MKKLKYLLLILGFVFLTSCEAMYPIVTSSNVNVNFGTYDYNQIHYLYTTNYDYFWNTRYINRQGVSCNLYQHPHFIRYRNDYYRKHNRHIPNQRSKYTNVRTHRNNTVRYNNTITRRNTSTPRRTYTVPQRTVTRNKPNVIRRTTPTVRRTPQRTTVRQPVRNQVHRKVQTHQPQRRTTTIKKRRN